MQVAGSIFPENHVDDQDDGQNPNTRQDIADDDCVEIHPYNVE